jgi:hypothetical protein
MVGNKKDLSGFVFRELGCVVGLDLGADNLVVGVELVGSTVVGESFVEPVQDELVRLIL